MKLSAERAVGMSKSPWIGGHDSYGSKSGG